jgi:hypothetical protein
MSVDPIVGVRPRLLLHAAHAAITVAWLTAYHNSDLDHDAPLRPSFEALEDGTGPVMEPDGLRVVS